MYIKQYVSFRKTKKMCWMCVTEPGGHLSGWVMILLSALRGEAVAASEKERLRNGHKTRQPHFITAHTSACGNT